MSLNLTKGLVALVVLLLGASCTSAEKTLDLESLEDRASYIFGYNFGKQLKQSPTKINLDVLIQALRDGQSEKESRLSDEEMQTTMRTVQEQQQAKMKADEMIKSSANQKEGEEFLAANAKKEGVTTTASGLQYKVLVEGKGDKPKSGNQVSVHYRGTLIDGTEFDSSYKRGEPATFGVTQVIPGWTEALMMMPEGSKWEVYIPSELAYGSGGAGGTIGPNATLVFEIELLSASAQ